MPYKKLGLICTTDCLPTLVILLKRLGFDVRALWCPDTDISIQTAAENDISFVSNKPDEVLLRKDVEMLIITGRPSFHAQLCVKALGIGKHVLCSAPAALTLVEAHKMVQIAHYYPQILALVGYGMRQLEVFRRMRKLIQRNYVGTPLVAEVRVQAPPLYSPDDYDWLWEKTAGGGVLHMVGCHVIDLLAFLLDRRADRAQGLVETHSKRQQASGFRRMNADDFASFLLRMPGMSATVTLNAIGDSEFEQEVCITGSEGQLVARNLQLFGFQSGTDTEQLLFDEDADLASPNGDLNSSHGSSQTGGSLNQSHTSIASLRRASVEQAPTSVSLQSGAPPPSQQLQVPSPGSIGGASFFSNLSTDDQLLYAPMPRLELYEKAFAKLLESLSAAIPHYDSELEKAGGPWKEFVPHLASVASFEDVRYVTAVIEAVRYSSDSGDWVNVQSESETKSVNGSSSEL